MYLQRKTTRSTTLIVQQKQQKQKQIAFLCSIDLNNKL